MHGILKCFFNKSKRIARNKKAKSLIKHVEKNLTSFAKLILVPSFFNIHSDAELRLPDRTHNAEHTFEYKIMLEK